MNRDQKRQERELIDGRMVAVGARVHGTTNTYVNWSCRCPECTEANSTANLRMRRARADRRVEIDGRMVAPLPESRHGQYSTYVNWCCRCEKCAAANMSFWGQRAKEG